MVGAPKFDEDAFNIEFLVQALSPSDIALIQSSFRTLSRHGDHAAALFYTRLYEFDPSLRQLSRVSFAEQKREFMKLLGTIVHRLECYELLRDHLCELALCHPDLCDKEENHHTVGAALFWMLEKILENAFTPSTYGAWMAVFHLLSHDIKAAARNLPLAS